jgi:hypothetical protein
VDAVIVAFGAILIVVLLIGFFRSLWRPSPRSGGNAGYGVIPGESAGDDSHHGVDGGSH